MLAFPVTDTLALRLARTSRDEMVAALGLARAPRPLRGAAGLVFERASRPLGRVLARFDSRISQVGVDRAAAETLSSLGAEVRSKGQVPATGALLVLCNHPGAYDALVLLACMQRSDVAIIAHDRSFLRMLPALEPHLVLVSETDPSARTAGLRRALRHLGKGGALLHFPAGQIEPDPAFDRPALREWHAGTGMLVRALERAGGSLHTAIVEAVHSPRAKRLIVTRVAERFGLTTLAPLLQVAVPKFHDVRARVVFSDVLGRTARPGDADREITARVRSSALRLLAESRA
jgi:hypothetical protein